MSSISPRAATCCALIAISIPAPAQTTYQLTHKYRQAESVVPVGDWNGDKHPDFLVGDPAGGRVELVSGYSFLPLKTWSVPAPGSAFGTRVAARDINKDGILDFVATAPGDQGGKGAFYLIDGKTLAIVAQGVGNGGTFGYSLCFADVYPFLPDGIPEVIVGAPTQPLGTSSDVGEVRVYEVKNYNVTFVGSSAGGGNRERYGEALASNGDLDGNPGDEYVITARGYYGSLGGCGGGYMVIKNQTATISVAGPAGVCFGSEVLIDDIDGDNEKELLVGCGFQNRTGEAHVYDFDKTTNKWVDSRVITPSPPIQNFGIDIIRVPDLNNDGIDDIAFAGTQDVQFWSARSFLPLENFTYWGVLHQFFRPQLAYFGDLDQDGAFEIGIASGSGSVPNFASGLAIWSKKTWPLTLDENYLNATNGGTINLNIDVGRAYAGQLFMVIGTLSGVMNPGKKFGNAAGLFTLVPDAYTFLLPNLVNHGPFINWLGFLDSNGRPSAPPRWTSGNVAAFAPLPMHLQVLVIDFTKPDFSYLSNARHFIIQ